MNLHTAHAIAPPAFRPLDLSCAPAIGSVVLRRLRTAADIDSVLHLRDEIDLSAHRGASNFRSLEQKETNSGLSSRSSLTGS